MWLAREEEAFGRTIEQGTRILEEHIARAKAAGEEGIGAADAFQLHDTYGFPFDLTLELAAEQGLGVDAQGFESLMEDQRTRARASAGRGGRDEDRERARAFADAAGFDTTFTGYETVEQATAVGAVDARRTAGVLVKLVESPFYATGGGQVHDAGEVRCESGDCRARVTDVLRLGDDQVLVLEPVAGELHEGERVVARVDRAARRATECNHTATHLLHAALRERLGTHVRQAGSYVGPDKLRFDFTHGAPLTAEDVARGRGPRQRVDPRRPAGARAHHDARRGAQPRRDGAVRREVRRRRADGRGRRRRVVARAVRRHARALDRRDRRLQADHGDLERGQRAPHRGDHRPGGDRGAAPQRPRAGRGRARPAHPAAPGRRPSPPSARPSGASSRRARGRAGRRRLDEGLDVDGVKVVVEKEDVANPKLLVEIADRIKGKLGDPSVIVLGTKGDGRVNLLVAATPGAIERGVKAGEIVKTAAAGGRRRGRRARHHGPGRRPRPGQAARRRSRPRSRRSAQVLA